MVKYSDLQAELAEIDENMIRNKLTALGTAKQLQRRKEIYEELYPEAKGEIVACNNLLHVSSNASGAHSMKSVTFVNDSASKTGKHPSTIRKYLNIANNLTDDLANIVKGTPIEDNFMDLLTLCRMEETERQLELINKVKSGEAKSVRAVLCRETREKNKNKLPDLTKEFVPTKAYKVLLQRHNKLELEYYRLLQQYEGVDTSTEMDKPQ